MREAHLVRQKFNGEDWVVHEYPPYGRLKFNLETKKAFWFSVESNKQFLVTFEGERPGYMAPRYPQAPQRGDLFYPLPKHIAEVYFSFMYKGFEGISDSFNECKFPVPGERDFREKLTPEEIGQCKSLIGKLKGLIDCGPKEGTDCAEIYQKEFGYLLERDENGEIKSVPKMNADEMYLANAGLSERSKTIGKLLVADYAVSYGVWGAMGLAATRGYKVVKAATYWGIASNAFSLVWPFSFDFENCRPVDQGGNLDDCRALNPSRFSERFQNELMNILIEPSRLDKFSNIEDGGLGRVVCLSMEHLYLNEAARFKSLPTPRCDKHTVMIGTQNYLYQSEGHLLKGNSGHDSVHFYLNGDFIEENHDTGMKRNLREHHQESDSFRVYSQNQRDYRELMLLRPRIQEVLKEDSCKPLR